jgi:hypothetical protein
METVRLEIQLPGFAESKRFLLLLFIRHSSPSSFNSNSTDVAYSEPVSTQMIAVAPFCLYMLK